MQLAQLSRHSLEFPPSSQALAEPNGLLAVGGDLSVERLLSAYRRGIFPWFSPGQPILWWTPDPRTVFFPSTVHCSSSLKKFIKRCGWRISVDRCFASVIEACSLPRKTSSGTWITQQMKSAYNQLHQAGFAHSVEIWDGQTLVGGLYGVALGRIFFGESMFSVRSNASKMAIVVLNRFLTSRGFALFDCQVASDHLFTLGAFTISRKDFEQQLAEMCQTATIDHMQSTWQAANKKLLSDDGHLLD